MRRPVPPPPEPAAPATPERVQKLLATAGLGARREIERWISSGRLAVNGQTATLGMKAVPSDNFTLDGKPLIVRAPDTVRTRVLVYHKPEGELTARKDEEGRPTVFDALPRLRGSRWISVGRLDFNTAGLILFTNDGQLANALMHPSREVEREYAVRVLGELDAMQQHRLITRVDLEDGPAKFDTLVEAGGEGTNRWYKVTLREGRNREVRRLIESQGLQVSRLMRTRYGPIALDPALRRGQVRDLEPEEIAAVYAAAGLPVPAEPVTVHAPRPARPGFKRTPGEGRRARAGAKPIHAAEKGRAQRDKDNASPSARRKTLELGKAAAKLTTKPVFKKQTGVPPSRETSGAAKPPQRKLLPSERPLRRPTKPKSGPRSKPKK
jgi:23S rRNA pseudouridine2605 synthase